MVVCPLFNGPQPHVGGPITGPGVPTVLIGNMPAAVMGDMITDAGGPNMIAMGSATVLIGNKPAARLGDPQAHGSPIVPGPGCPTVIIGG